jgi:general secretion pathway protein A
MYTRHFGLSQAPFSIAPDPRYLFMSERHREALAHLLYGVRGGGGFVVLTGEIGAGKTTVCRCFLEQVPERCKVGYIFNPKLTVEELLRSVCDEFGIVCRHDGPGAATVKDYVDALNEFLLRTHAAGQDNVLIIDEAQNLSADVLEQLRLLTNLETNERKLLQIVLIGQPELRAMLARPDLQQLAQRVIARYHLGALSDPETAHYVRHRLAVAGLSQANPFSDKSLRRIFRYTRGVPRRINLLCDRALLGAYAGGKPQVDTKIVDRAAHEVLDIPDFATIKAARLRSAVWIALGAVALGALGIGAYIHSQDSRLVAQAQDSGTTAPAPMQTPAASVVAAAQAARAPQVIESPAVRADQAPQRDAAPLDLPAGFASLAGPGERAWRELAGRWKIGPIDRAPCEAVRRDHLLCFKRKSATLTLIRQLDRPGILTLRDGEGRSALVMLDGLSDKAAILNIEGEPRAVPLTVLADYWRGEFTTLWRTPEGYGGKIETRPGAPSAAWIARQLATVRGEPLQAGAQPDEASLRGWISAFQLTQGLPTDGVAGAVTLMQLNRATGVDEPHLQKAQ